MEAIQKHYERFLRKHHYVANTDEKLITALHLKEVHPEWQAYNGVVRNIRLLTPGLLKEMTATLPKPQLPSNIVPFHPLYAVYEAILGRREAAKQIIILSRKGKVYLS